MPALETFESFQEAVRYGQRFLKQDRNQREVVIFSRVHVHRIAVTREGFCHAALYVTPTPLQEAV